MLPADESRQLRYAFRLIGLLKRWLGRGTAHAEARSAAAGSAARSPAAGSGDGLGLFVEGVAQFRGGDFRRAAELFEGYLSIAHDDAEAHLNLGLARQRLRLLEDAADSYAMALHFRPGYAAAHFNLGVLELEAGAPESAAARFEEALRLDPQYAEALSNLAVVQFRHLGRLEEAEATLGRALAVRPGYPDAITNLGMLRHAQGRFEEALALYDEVLRHDPGSDEARLNRALLMLGRADFAEGWEEYEVRRRASPHFTRRFERYPEWDGARVPERTVLVYAEQGLGDEIMFASCLPEAIASTRHCVVDCSPKLAALFRRSFPAATVHGGLQNEADLSWLAHAPPIDFQIAIGSLPRRFRRRADAFPPHAGYLKADPEKTLRWRDRLRGLGFGLKVGISWRGGTGATRRDTRSIALEELVPLLRNPGARFVSLQYTDCAAELERAAATHGVRIEHWQDAIDDYDETAALVTALDLVICVQTAVAHLAGALGRPAWVLVPVVPEWRYQLKGERLPWYPSLRLFRQSQEGRWQSAIEQVARDLQSLQDRGAGPDG